MPTKTKDIAAFMATARERFQLSSDADYKFRAQALESLRFYGNIDGAQWPAEIRAAREAEGRPCLTFPVIKQFVRQIANKIRKNKPSPIVTPIGDEDVDTAEVIMGLDRKIERQSKADVPRSYAALYAIITGRGWYKLATRYESEGVLDAEAGVDIFDQEIYVERIKNQAGIYPDPTAQQPDYSDMNYCFEIEDYQRKEYALEYPDSEAADLSDWTSLGDQAIHWMTADTVRVAKYWHVETENLKVALIVGPDGEALVLPLKDVPEGVEILKQRTLKRRVVVCSTINGIEILEEKTWPIEWIPLLPVLGDELHIDGQTELSGMVDDIKSAAMQYNFMRTAQVEVVGLAPKAPYIAAEGQIEGFEDQWENANRRNYAVLTYKAEAVGDKLVPAPQRQNYEPAIQAITLAVGQAYEDLKRGSGIHDASLGAKSNETSGVAILAREDQSEDANFHYRDNLTTAISHEFRMRVALMRFIYDRPGRIARIIGEEGDEKTVTLNKLHTDKQGVEKIFDITVGRYDVAVTVGPTTASKRLLAGDTWMQLTKAYPPLMQIAGDVLVKNLDVSGAREVAERLKKMLPAEVREDEGDEKAKLGQMQSQLAQSGQMIEALTAKLNEAHDEIESNQPAIDSKERIELEKLAFAREELKANTELALAKLGSAEAIVELREDLARIKQQMQIDAQQAAAGEAQRAAAEQQEAGQEHASGEAEAGRQHASGEAEASRAHMSAESEAGRVAAVAAAKLPKAA